MAYSRSKTANVQGESTVSCIPVSCILKQECYERLLDLYNEDSGANSKGFPIAKGGPLGRENLYLQKAV